MSLESEISDPTTWWVIGGASAAWLLWALAGLRRVKRRWL